MSKPFHSPTPEIDAKAENTSANVSSQSETTETAKSEIKETFKPGKGYDAEMETKFGKEPSEQKVIEYFAGDEKFKGKTYQDILIQLQEDRNAPMAERLRKRVKGSVKQLNSENAASATDAEIDAYLADRGFDGKNKIVPKSADANKAADMSGFNITSTKVRLKAGDLIIGQTSSSGENVVFRVAPINPSERRYISISQPGASASEEKIKELKTQYAWYEVMNNDIEPKETKKPEAKIEAAPEIKKESTTEVKVEDISPKKEKKAETPTVETKKAVESTPEPKTEAPKKEAKVKKSWKVDINPFNRARHLGTRILSGVGGFASRVNAKAAATLARPQDIFYGKYWTDLGKNLIRTPKSIIKTITGTFYKPHRENVKFEDVYKGYGPTRGPNAKKYKLAKNIPWFLGKFVAPAGGALPKFGANLERGFSHVIHETLEAVRDSKRHRNPKKRNFKTFKYGKTKESFKRAFTWDKQPEENIKMDDNSKDISNAA